MPMSSAQLIYRAPEPDDLDRLFAIYSDPRTQLFNPSGPMTDEAQAAGMLEGWIEHWETHGYGWWAIARKDAPEHIIGFGGIGLHDFMGEQRINLGYRFAVEAWGKGFATEMGRAALAFGFSSLNLGDVYGYVRPTHAASIRVLEKIGMKRCGELDDVPGQAPSLMFKGVAAG
ncbi:GNAT family N-acetyltransferase [Pseudomonas graminis]|uniref:Protein N-acetyltransferase, RimJ/RimL family n=1 Tax=Pseudomonas graminis TaxID=158627 RepID=A0A1I0IMD5_9PSED|nr:GNAT family N-acetyltransferase [Pseudomonas graminis]SET97555.1 Protein N-acetyltransferase, RimJ/RimL family [Pseudomonas graminis]